MSSQNTLPRITQEQNNYSISVYDDEFTPEFAIKEVVRLREAFPNIPFGFFDILLERIKQNGFTNKRLTDAINYLIDNFTYPVPTIANIISYDKRIKLLTYAQLAYIVNDYGTRVFENFKPVKKIGNVRLFASIQDIETYKLEILKNE